MGFEKLEQSQNLDQQSENLKDHVQKSRVDTFQEQSMTVESDFVQEKLDPQDQRDLQDLSKREQGVYHLEGTASMHGVGPEEIRLMRLAGISVEPRETHLILKSHMSGDKPEQLVLTENMKPSIDVTLENGQRVLRVRPWGPESSQQEMKVPILANPDMIKDYVKAQLEIHNMEGVSLKEVSQNATKNELKAVLKTPKGDLPVTIRPKFDPEIGSVTLAITVDGAKSKDIPKDLQAFLQKVKTELSDQQA